MNYFFPFGEKLKIVRQIDTNSKKVFVLGVYASAVHARWKDTNGKIKVNAFAVASEPEIFWRGNNCQNIIERIKIPKELGTLEPALEIYNGPSGKALDKLFLDPLSYSRKDAWLCDLLPYARINPNQRKAINKYYEPNKNKFGLPECTIPNFSRTELKKQSNRQIEILEELENSKAETIILLGDLPIKFWLSNFTKYKKLSEFGETSKDYGQFHQIRINGKNYNFLPLVHPRQANNLGKSSLKWNQLHQDWINKIIKT